MEKEQAIEWVEAQKIRFSIDLVEAAKNHLKFLAVVDQNRYLYEDHTLERAIYRYNAYWLPLLAKHLEKPLCEEALVVPLDCEWIWHCHRLNPLRYKSDCEKLFGRILGFRNVVSSAQATSTSKTEEIWKEMYPEEPYELDMTLSFVQKSSGNENFTDYDLLAAVKRQISFTFQASRPYMKDDLYLQESLARYKGFIHMVRYTEAKNIKCFCVPTYDVDLIWHTHQLHPDAYCGDMTNAVGRVVHHNDKIADRSPEKLLMTGFKQITKQWEETFRNSYWKAGSLHRQHKPTPVTQVPLRFVSNVEDNEFNVASDRNLIQFPQVNVTEALIEFVELENLPEEHKGKVFVRFSKKQPDKLFNTKKSLRISSDTGEKQVSTFECEASGEFLFEVMSLKSLKRLGSCHFSVEELMASKTQLSVDKWLSLEPTSADISSKPIFLHVSASFTPPTTAPMVFRMAPSNAVRNVENAKMCTGVFDQEGKYVFSLYIGSTTRDSAEEVCCITSSGKKHKLAEFVENQWCLKGSDGSFKLQHNSKDDGSLFELVGYKLVKLFPGRRLDFETGPLEKQTPEQGLMTAVEFSTDYPYGKAVALIDFKSGIIKATEEWIVLPGITSAILAYDILKDRKDCEIRDAARCFMERDAASAGRCLVAETGIMVHNGDNAATCALDCSSCGEGDFLVEGGVLAKHADCGSGCFFGKTMVKSGDNAATCALDCSSCGEGDFMVKGAHCMSGYGFGKTMVKNGDNAATCALDCSSCGEGDFMVKGAHYMSGYGFGKTMVKNGDNAATCALDCSSCGEGDFVVKGAHCMSGYGFGKTMVKNGDNAATCAFDCSSCGEGDFMVKGAHCMSGYGFGKTMVKNGDNAAACSLDCSICSEGEFMVKGAHCMSGYGFGKTMVKNGDNAAACSLDCSICSEGEFMV